MRASRYLDEFLLGQPSDFILFDYVRQLCTPQRHSFASFRSFITFYFTYERRRPRLRRIILLQTVANFLSVSCALSHVYFSFHFNFSDVERNRNEIPFHMNLLMRSTLRFDSCSVSYSRIYSFSSRRLIPLKITIPQNKALESKLYLCYLRMRNFACQYLKLDRNAFNSI